MELITKKTNSQDLLACGRGLSEKLLLTPKSGRSLQTEKVPRSCVLERLQNFLPQIAQANEKLKQQIDEAPAGHFDIECVEEAERIIEMDVALVELHGSDSSSEDDGEVTDCGEDLDSDSGASEITEQNLKLPGHKGKKKMANIKVLE
ncbi:NOP protein chaperone 1 isoform 2-T2 [Menidia menidia]|uniref:(Atlantic silverside) hypothetical protein n=1 Tax=Menidia menidia TaxID=238744 RepID=A0A8S4B7D7_9TELE|nr:unnamed protein product [Menidia menidia]